MRGKMIRVVVFSILINGLLCFSPVNAQSRAIVSQSIKSGEYNSRGGSSSGVSSCWKDHAEIGKMVGQAYVIVRNNERVRGGTLYFQESSSIRSLIYYETLNVRESVSAIAYDGDAQQCHRLRESAKRIINGILSDNQIF